MSGFEPSTGGTTSRGRFPVLHAVHAFGLPSETFIRDAIAEVEELGWLPWVVTEAKLAEDGVVPPERMLIASNRLPLVDRVAIRTHLHSSRDEVRGRAARKYLAALSRLPPGILHAHFGWTAVDCTLAARRLGLPFLVSFHGTDLTVDAGEAQWKPHYAVMLRRADAVTVVSRFLASRLRELGYEGDIELVPSGVRLTHFPFSGGPRPGTAPRLLFVGRLIECKGVDVALKALASLRASGLAATLRIVGDGPLRAELETAARALGLRGAVDFMGARSHAEVRGELECSDFVVVPSRRMPNGQEEGSSVVSKEAQAIGVPVIATDVGGIPETLPPELRCELVPPDQPEMLAARLIDVWGQRDRWRSRVRIQHEWIASEFAWDKIARRIADIYERLIESRPPGRSRLARSLRTLRHVGAASGGQ
jgi:colanic acid/amylovoran biosynthesis glycosyltransferase